MLSVCSVFHPKCGGEGGEVRRLFEGIVWSPDEERECGAVYGCVEKK